MKFSKTNAYFFAECARSKSDVSHTVKYETGNLPEFLRRAKISEVYYYPVPGFYSLLLWAVLLMLQRQLLLPSSGWK